MGQNIKWTNVGKKLFCLIIHRAQSIAPWHVWLPYGAKNGLPSLKNVDKTVYSKYVIF